MRKRRRRVQKVKGQGSCPLVVWTRFRLPFKVCSQPFCTHGMYICACSCMFCVMLTTISHLHHLQSCLPLSLLPPPPSLPLSLPLPLPPLSLSGGGFKDQFVDRLMKTYTSEAVFLLTTLVNMARARPADTEQEREFINTIVLEIFEVQ